MRLFLAAPYSHPDHRKKAERRKATDKWALRLMIAGHKVFSPITHTAPLESLMVIGEQPPAEFWLGQSLEFISWADEIWVLGLHGWEKSEGVGEEIWKGREEGKRIFLMDKNSGDLRRISIEEENLRIGEVEKGFKVEGSE